MEPAVRVELTTNGLQIRCSATELRRQVLSSNKSFCWKKERRIMRIMHAESILRCEVFPQHLPVTKKLILYPFFLLLPNLNDTTLVLFWSIC